MYAKESRIIGARENLSNYIEGEDVYNSLFLHIINDPTIERSLYQITVYEYRPDLIARDFYGSEDYLGILLVQVGLSLEQYKKGTVLSLIPKSIIDGVLANM